MIPFMYLLAFVSSLILLFFLINLGRTQNITLFIILFFLVTIADFGFFAMSVATNIHSAIFANFLSYVGSIFAPLVISISVADVCHIKFPRWLITILSIFCFVILTLACTIGYSPIYYSSVSFSTADGFAHLDKTYGPFHILFTMQLALYIVIMFIMLISSFFRQEKVSYTTIIAVLIAETITVSCYYINRALHSPAEWMPLAYFIDELLIVIFLRRLGMYDVAKNALSTLEDEKSYGYVIFNYRHCFFGSNESAKFMIPDIKKLKIDQPISTTDSFLYENFEVWMNLIDAGDNNYEHQLIIDETHLRCTIKRMTRTTIFHKTKNIGYLIEIIDDTERQAYIKNLSNYNASLEEAVNDKTKHISTMQDNLLISVATLIESRDNSTGGHIKRTSGVVKIFANKLQKHYYNNPSTAKFLNTVAKAAPLHDLGKIAVDDKILKKKGKFTPEEFAEMKQHAAKGGEIVKSILESSADEYFLKIAVNIAHYHHEKYDGSGYPEHLKGSGIPMEARIMALADVFDALVSKRCYKNEMSYNEAFSIIENSLGTHFDPELGRIFLTCRPELEAFYNNTEKN